MNPIAFFEGLRGIGREFGAVKVKPPPDWAPPFALQALLKDQLLFNVRTQEIHSLMHGKVSSSSVLESAAASPHPEEDASFASFSCAFPSSPSNIQRRPFRPRR